MKEVLVKRIISFLMVAFVIIGFVAACGGSGEAQPAKTTGKTFENDY